MRLMGQENGHMEGEGNSPGLHIILFSTKVHAQCYTSIVDFHYLGLSRSGGYALITAECGCHSTQVIRVGLSLELSKG